MCNVYEEAYSKEKKITNKSNIGLTLRAFVEKTIQGVETHRRSGKEKFWT